MILQRLKLDRKCLPVKTAYIQIVISKKMEYVVCKNISRQHMKNVLRKLSSVLDIVEI